MQTITINGENFEDVKGFYAEISQQLTGGRMLCRNLDGLNDLLRGGFGETIYGEPLTIRWLNAEKSREDLGDTLMLTILTIMLTEDMGHEVHVVLA